jgi:DNA-binding NarL/FixJ family response regulator
VGGGPDQPEPAAILLGAAAMLSQTMGNPPANWPDLLTYHDECQRNAQAALDETTFRAAFADGESLAINDAVDYALGERSGAARSHADSHASGTKVSAATPPTLTRREQQTAHLIAEGLTNKDIAARLVISQRTAESHVKNVLAKLRFTSRTQIAAWMAQQSPNDRQPLARR